MAMTEHAYSSDAASFEIRQMRVLDGSAAKARADARRSDAVKLALGVISVFVYLLGLAFLSAQITSAGAELNSLQAQISELENQADLADLTIGAKSSLERIESYAVSELGMVYPDPDETYFLSEQSSEAIANGRDALAATETQQEAQTSEHKWLFSGRQAAAKGAE